MKLYGTTSAGGEHESQQPSRIAPKVWPWDAGGWTASEEFLRTRPAFRYRHLIALARVTASQNGYTASDQRDGGEGTRVPGYEKACRLLRIEEGKLVANSGVIRNL
jgi:hypothetical protein